MYNFNAAQQTENLIKWIKDWFDENGKGCNAVLGISGGKDSTIAAALCAKALGADRVIGVMLPDGEQSDINDSIEVCRLLGIRNYTINIRSALEASFKQLQDCGIEITKQCRQNIAPRERTKMIRAVCQCNNGRMINTCNYSEDYAVKRYADEIGGDVKIIPSSINEILLTPANCDINSEEIASVNNGLSEDEILSDHPYIYIKGLDQIVSCN